MLAFVILPNFPPVLISLDDVILDDMEASTTWLDKEKGGNRNLKFGYILGRKGGLNHYIFNLIR